MKRIYFIRPIGIVEGPVKIGISRDPSIRRETLAVWVPYPLEIAAEIEGTLTVERQFHAMFDASWIHHEWFRWSTELENVISRINAGTFNLSELPAVHALPRRRRDNSYITPSWCYEQSVHRRLDNIKYPKGESSYTHLERVLGKQRFSRSFDWTAHRDQLEALINDLRAA